MTRDDVAKAAAQGLAVSPDLEAVMEDTYRKVYLKGRDDERERCAKIAESHRSIVSEGGPGYEHAKGWTAAGEIIAAEIRSGE